MFSFVYNHMKMRIVVFFLPQNESFISAEENALQCFSSGYFTAGTPGVTVM